MAQVRNILLKKRAQILQQIRHFFIEKNLLEVETPLLSQASVTDPHVLSMPAIFQERGSEKEKIVYLQTSPEYAMKRLLADGIGPIFQICKAFRQSDLGNVHNPEFTILEWYQPGYDHHALMDEMDQLLQLILKVKPAERMTYADLYKKFLGFDPHVVTVETLKQTAREKINFVDELSDKNAWLDLLFTHCIEPEIARERPIFIYDFPADQAALAKIRFEENPPVASRFEVYFKGLELANGFHELQDAKEQRKRFEMDLKKRVALNLPLVPLDENFLKSLEKGLPDCAGVALGIDRLIMLALECESIKSVISFSFEEA